MDKSYKCINEIEFIHMAHPLSSVKEVTKIVSLSTIFSKFLLTSVTISLEKPESKCVLTNESVYVMSCHLVEGEKPKCRWLNN